MTKLFLFGSTGYLGSRIFQYFAEKGTSVVAVKTDVTDIGKVREALHGVNNAVVINATGKTGKPNVDWCEDHRLETAAVNITGAINVAKVTTEQGNYVVQMGSGCIFDSSVISSDSSVVLEEEESRNLAFRIPHVRELRDLSTPPFKNSPRVARDDKDGRDDRKSNGMTEWKEDDPPNFFGSFYSITKGVAEMALREIPNVCVLRIRMPLSAIPHPKNLLTKLLQYKKILNVPNSVTVIEDFLPFLERVIEKRVTGVLNAVNPGVYHHRDLLELYRKNVDGDRPVRQAHDKQFEYITLDEFAGMTKAKRSNCVLSTKKSEAMGIAMPRIEDSLRKIVEGYRKALGYDDP